jgi:DNA-binding transcriptional MerR regulator
VGSPDPEAAGIRLLDTGNALSDPPVRPANTEHQEESMGDGDLQRPGNETAPAPRVSRDAVLSAGRQGLLFDEHVQLPADAGYRGPTACAAAGITYRQLDYWARTGLVEPSVRGAQGSGTQRLYDFRDILVLKVVKRLLDTGVSLQNIRTAVNHLRERGVDDLAQITLMSDGASVYECTSADEVIDLVQAGQGVFGIAVGRVWREVEGSLANLPSERPADPIDAVLGAPSNHPSDELARRRQARQAG